MSGSIIKIETSTHQKRRVILPGWVYRPEGRGWKQSRVFCILLPPGVLERCEAQGRREQRTGLEDPRALMQPEERFSETREGRQS